MSLLTTATDRAANEPTRTRWWWLLLAGVAMGQLFAFWLLCSHQMRKAEARHNEAVVQQMALSDCLQYIPGSTIASCTGPEAAPKAARPADQAAVAGAVPVNFSFR